MAFEVLILRWTYRLQCEEHFIWNFLTVESCINELWRNIRLNFNCLCQRRITIGSWTKTIFRNSLPWPKIIPSLVGNYLILWELLKIKVLANIADTIVSYKSFCRFFCTKTRLIFNLEYLQEVLTYRFQTCQVDFLGLVLALSCWAGGRTFWGVASPPWGNSLPHILY